MPKMDIYSTVNKLICTIDIDPNMTIGDLKNAINKHAYNLRPERQSIRNDIKGKDIKDCTYVLDVQMKISNRLYVKDLGPQVSWSSVFIAEYLASLIVYSMIMFKRKDIYGEEVPLEKAAVIAGYCWMFHYGKRLLETVFIHRFSHETMPLYNLMRNCWYYTGFAAYIAYHVNHPLYTPPGNRQLIAGGVIFIYAEMGNLSSHVLLRNLRPQGSSVRRIPVPDGNPFNSLFNYVSCANYTYEFIAWIGFSILSNCFPAILFTLAGFMIMTSWALQKHKNYKKEFTQYPRNRKAIIPFVL